MLTDERAPFLEFTEWQETCPISDEYDDGIRGVRAELLVLGTPVLQLDVSMMWTEDYADDATPIPGTERVVCYWLVISADGDMHDFADGECDTLEQCCIAAVEAVEQLVHGDLTTDALKRSAGAAVAGLKTPAQIMAEALGASAC